MTADAKPEHSVLPGGSSFKIRQIGKLKLVELTVHRGTREVGGTCIEIRDQGTRIILDVGLPLFGPDREPLDSFELQRMTKEELSDTGILVSVPGLFDDDPAPDAILLSHAHLDHTGLLAHSRPEIPVYASRGTSKMMLAGKLFARQVELPRERFREFKAMEPTRVGDFTVTAFPVDHSIFGSLAFLIESETKSVLYTGDLRLHGRKPGMHHALIEAVKDRSIDVLLVEGTHIDQPDYRGPSEYDIEDEIADHIRSAPGLVLASFSPQHADRLVGFLRAAKKTERIFVVDIYTAFILHLIASETPVPRPETTDWVKVFYPKFFEQTFRQKRLEKLHFLMSPARIGMEEIRANPSRYVMVFRPSMLESDFGGSLPSGTLGLYSRWAGYLDRPEWQPVQAALEKSSGALVEVHTSGHIYARDIVELVTQLNAKTVIPVHTFEPERFTQFSERVSVLRDGENYVVE